MNYHPTVHNSTYTQWLITLIAIICEFSKLQPSEIAITEDEVKGYYINGKDPYYVYHTIWMEDAGNFFAI